VCVGEESHRRFVGLRDANICLGLAPQAMDPDVLFVLLVHLDLAGRILL